MQRKHATTAGRTRRVAFTLVEVLLVLVILGVIPALVVPNLLGSTEKARLDDAKIRLKKLEAQLDIYSGIHLGDYPEKLEVLLQPKDRDGKDLRPMIEQKDLLDPWGTPYNYQPLDPSDKTLLKPYKLWSNGPNKQNDNGSGDDIASWDTTRQQ